MMQEWFEKAKLGIFLHWGIYAVKGIPESWSFYRGDISYEDYMSQLEEFTAENYDPAAWAKLFAQAGADYAVLTAKHHDGVALWDTDLSDLNVVDATPAGRDLIGPYCEALRAEGIKVGIYFSHLDWSHPDYPSVRPHDRTIDDPGQLNPRGYATGEEEPARWERFLEFHRGQLEELCRRYQPDLLWFDGDWERDDEQWRMAELRELLHQWCPHVVLNSRMRGHGDYATPEQGLPVRAPEGPWEFCMTMNNSWGYQVRDEGRDKSLRQLVWYYVECISRGGKLLLDIGPYADGSLQPDQNRRLQEIGEWTHKYDEALHGTVAGLPEGLFAGGSTLSEDRRTLYLFLYDPPQGPVPVKGIRNKVLRVTSLADDAELPWEKLGGAGWVNIPGVLWISAQKGEPDPVCTVLKVELESELDTWLGEGGAIEQN
ncbi:MAG: alpha-L-fucosidase [Phycisphaerae bacterium]